LIADKSSLAGYDQRGNGYGHDSYRFTYSLADRCGAELASQPELGLLPLGTARIGPAGGHHSGGYWTALSTLGSLARAAHRRDSSRPDDVQDF
jgi:hypothetical protein